jgi:hypothetical protein
MMKQHSLFQAKLKNRLEGALRVHLTIDAWTSTSQHPFLGITCHWIDANIELHNCLLAAETLEGPHSGENMADVVMNVAERFNILTKLGIITTDNASSNDTMAREIEMNIIDHYLDWEADYCHIPCLAHVFRSRQ